MGVLVGALGMLYAHLFNIEIADYLPFVAVGFIVWGLIADGCETFIGAEGIVKQMNLPLSVHVYRAVWRNFIVFAHNAIIYVVVAVLFAIWPGWSGLLALPGLALLCLSGVWVGLLFGLVSARSRDVSQIVVSIVQVSFFLTPIIWTPELLSGRSSVLDVNPFFHLVEVVRAPLLGQTPALLSWFAVLGVAGGGWLATYVMYRRYCGRIAYWI